MHSGAAVSHDGMINYSSPHFVDYAAASNIHASARSGRAVESGSSGRSSDHVQNLEENTIGNAGRAQLPDAITVLHRFGVHEHQDPRH